jgi:hypothetical protein
MCNAQTLRRWRRGQSRNELEIATLIHPLSSGNVRIQAIVIDERRNLGDDSKRNLEYIIAVRKQHHVAIDGWQ